MFNNFVVYAENPSKQFLFLQEADISRHLVL